MNLAVNMATTLNDNREKKYQYDQFNRIIRLSELENKIAL